MRFHGSGGDSALLGLRDALLEGYPRSGGLFVPADEADLRPAIYGPELGLRDAAASAISALLPGEADPRLAELLSAAFELPADSVPLLHAFGEDLLLIDLARAPGGSATWFSAAFAAALLSWAARPARRGGPGGNPCYVAAAAGSEAAALAEAFGRAGLPLFLILPRGEAARGIRPALLARGGGSVRMLELDGDLAAASALERSLAGAELSGRQVIAAGAGSPGRLLGRVVLLVSLFSLAHRGASGDLLLALPPGEGFGLLTGLWAWRWGLPVTAFISCPARPGTESSQAPALLAEFFRDTPLRSLVLEEDPSLEEASSAARELLAAGGPLLDRDSAFALAAGRKALAAGLKGHARIVSPRIADPAWNPILENPRGAEPPGLPADARIGAEPGAFAACLAGLPS
jgi:threonine synthase